MERETPPSSQPPRKTRGSWMGTQRRSPLQVIRDLSDRTRGIAIGALSVAIIWAIVAFVTGGHAEQQAQKPAESAKPAANETSVASTTVSTVGAQPAKKASRKVAPAPAESALPSMEPTTTGTSKLSAPKPPKPVFTASIAADLSTVVSYNLTGEIAKDAKVSAAFDAIVNAFGASATYKAADKGEWVYERKISPPQAVTYVAARKWNVDVTFKSNPTSQDLDRLTKPILNLATALGLGQPARGLWRDANGPTREFVLVQPEPPAPAGTSK